ncbi:MAG: alanine--tRNA ligase [Promethearchaeota archaeon]
MAISKAALRKLFKREHYEVELFRDKGFTRKKCNVCGSFYWTLNTGIETCGDTQCVGGYQFIGESVNGGWGFHEAIARWNGFFEHHGHAKISEYPIVARWRDDIPFTIASIACFQPWVVTGTVDPPANPLVIPQPCLRTIDIDNIGRTGRHLSSFIMGGQHAFNSDHLKGYWMDRCIELNFKFLTEEMKISQEELTYKEDVWAGGGNFGPCLEAFSKGLEIVNNVFMQYQFTNGAHKQLDIRVIDVGWGLERLAFFTQGTPTIYEATFGSVLEFVKKEVGISPDQDFLGKYVILAGLLDVDEVKNIDSVRKDIAHQLEIDPADLEREIAPLEGIYAVTDHMRTLVFAIADGAIPSNIGGGYNLRVLLRRAITFNDHFGFNLDLPEICHKHIDYLQKTYRRVKAASEIIDEIFNIELQRYRKTIESGRALVRRHLKKKKKIDRKILAEWYTANGILPEIVSEEAKELGVTVEVPADFFKEIGESKTIEKTESVVDDFEQKLKTLDATYRLYYDNPYETEFDAKILKIIDNNLAVLDKTLFYPTSGGQLFDTGTLDNFGVVETKIYGRVIVHKLDATLSREYEGKTVHGQINWKRRIELMRHHTAAHIINAAARTLLGSHVWQVGAEKSPERARLDISHFKSLTGDELREIEAKANLAVMQNKPVQIEWKLRNIAEQEYGFTIYQGGIVPGSEIRIVKIEDWDAEACGGLHCKFTGEIGIIRCMSSERIQDGVVRIEFTAGEAAVRYMQQREQLLEKTAQILRVPIDQVPKTANKFFEEWKERGKRIEQLTDELILEKMPKLIKNATTINNFSLVLAEVPGNRDELIKLSKRITDDNPSTIVILANKNQRVTIVGSSGKTVPFSVIPFVKEACTIVGGGAGGKEKERLVIGGGPDISKFEMMMSSLKTLLIDTLKNQ